MHRYCNESNWSCELSNWIFEFNWFVRQVDACFSTESWCDYCAYLKHQSSTNLWQYVTFSENVDEQYRRSYSLNLKEKLYRWPACQQFRQICYSILTFTVFGLTHFCSNHQRSTETIAKRVRSNLGKSILLTWVAPKSFRFIYSSDEKTKKIFCIQSTSINIIKTQTRSSYGRHCNTI